MIWYVSLGPGFWFLDYLFNDRYTDINCNQRAQVEYSSFPYKRVQGSGLSFIGEWKFPENLETEKYLALKALTE